MKEETIKREEKQIIIDLPISSGLPAENVSFTWLTDENKVVIYYTEVTLNIPSKEDK